MLKQASRWLTIVPLLWVMEPALAGSYALLVGATDYVDPAIADLKGPANDVQGMERMLLNRGFERQNIEILADGVRGRPTRKNIIAALHELESRVSPGDFVFLFFSGHGTQQPDTSGDESDGMDEVFMPIDIGPWSKEKQALENGLVDDELDELIGRLEGKGAKVWYVADHCYSGTVDKGASDDEIIERFTPPEALSVPPIHEVTPDAGPLEPDRNMDEAGGSRIVFFASAPDQKALEMPFPRDLDAPERRYHGELTYTLMQLLSENRNWTYGALTDRLMQYYAQKNQERERSNRARVDPVFAGYTDDEPVFN